MYNIFCHLINSVFGNLQFFAYYQKISLVYFNIFNLLSIVVFKWEVLDENSSTSEAPSSSENTEQSSNSIPRSASLPTAGRLCVNVQIFMLIFLCDNDYILYYF